MGGGGREGSTVIPSARCALTACVLASLVSSSHVVVAWNSAAEMTRAQYMLVGRYMVRHFDRAEEMLTALQGEQNNALRHKKYVLANEVMAKKLTYSRDYSAIIRNYIGKAEQFLREGHPQTAVAIWMELSKLFVPKKQEYLRCCEYEDAVAFFVNRWTRLIEPEGRGPRAPAERCAFKVLPPSSPVSSL